MVKKAWILESWSLYLAIYSTINWGVHRLRDLSKATYSCPSLRLCLVFLREVPRWTNQAFPFSFSLADYLQFSRAFFLISVFATLVALVWLISSCLSRRGSITTNLDLKVSILSFISGTDLDWQGTTRVKLSREPSCPWGFHPLFLVPFLFFTITSGG